VHGHESFKINTILLCNNEMQFNQFYNQVRERDIFLNVYMNDCTVSFTCSYTQVR